MALGQVSDFYGPAAGFSDLTRQQSNQSISVGNTAAKMADPFMDERPQYQNALSKLVADPGSFSSSPFYKFAYDEGLNALQRKGGVRSGNKLAELMRYGQDRASQSYFPQAQLLGNLAMSGSNPGAGALAMVSGYNRGQDQRAMSAASGAYGASGGSGASQTPWYMAPDRYAQQDAYRAREYGTPMPSYGGSYGGADYGYSGYGASLPSGGYGGGYSDGGYSDGYDYGNWTDTDYSGINDNYDYFVDSYSPDNYG